MTVCPQCGEEFTRKYELTEDGSIRSYVPDRADGFCIDVEYFNSHEVELTVYMHEVNTTND